MKLASLSALVVGLLWFGGTSLAGTYKGRVLKSDGSPAVGATVRCCFEDVGNGWQRAVYSDDAGNFSIEADNPNGRPVCAFAALGDHTAAFGWLNEKPTDLKVVPTVVLKVSLVDSENHPVRDARVRLRVMSIGNTPFDYYFIPENATEPFAFKSDSNGQVVFPHVLAGQLVNIAVEDDRFAQLSEQENDIPLLASKPTNEAGHIRLVPAASVSGRVTFGATGKPAAGVRVSAQSQRGAGFSSAVTAADGTYTMSRLRASVYNIALDLDENEKLSKDWTAVALEDYGVESGAHQTDADLSLISGTIITGKLLLDDTKKPLADVAIGVYGPAHPQSSGWVQRTITAADGSYTLRVPPGQQYVYVMQSRGTGFVVDNMSKKITTVDGKPSTVDFLAHSTANNEVIKGKVVDAQGNPVAGAKVMAVPPIWEMAQPFAGTTNSDGTFTVEAPRSKKKEKLWAEKDDLFSRKAVDWKPGQRDPINLTVEPNVQSAIEGRVLDTAGQPVTEARVQLVRMYGDIGIGVNSKVDDQGRYRFDKLFAGGEYSVEITTVHYKPDSSKRLTLKPGETTSVPQFELQKYDSQIAGTIIGEDGKPLVNQGLSIASKKTGNIWADTDEKGRFHVSTFAGDTLSLSLFLTKGQRRVERTVQAGDEKIYIDLSADKKDGGL